MGSTIEGFGLTGLLKPRRVQTLRGLGGNCPRCFRHFLEATDVFLIFHDLATDVSMLCMLLSPKIS